MSNPCPGQYEFERDNVLKKSLETYNSSKYTSSFKDKLNLRRYGVNLYDPFKVIDKDSNAVPGPGFYNLEKNTIFFKDLEKQAAGLQSSMFVVPQAATSDNSNSALVNLKNAAQ